MMKPFIILFLISIKGHTANYLESTYDIYDCFSTVESNEYSPARRNNGFRLCQKYHTPHNYEFICPALADNYYGLSAKRNAMNQCLKITTSFETCRKVSDMMPTYPMRMTSNLTCLNNYINTLSKDQCYQLAKNYHPIRKRVTAICLQHFQDESEMNRPNTTPQGPPEVIVY